MQFSKLIEYISLDDLTVVIPEKDEEHLTLNHTKSLLEKYGAEVIVISDGSKNPPKYSIQSKFHGYGNSIMSGCLLATRPLVLTMDGDGQHTPIEAIKLYLAYKMSNVEMMIGSRRLDREKPYRMIGRKLLNMSASLFAFRYLSDLNSGMRIFRLETVKGYFPILCKHFSFTTSLTMSMLCDNHTIEWFPIKVEERTRGESHVNLIKDAFVTLYYIIRIGGALRTRGIRKVLRKFPLWMYLTGKGWRKGE